MSALRSVTSGGPRATTSGWASLTRDHAGRGLRVPVQCRDGLIVTGMNDQVSWGLYISNFTFLVGVAAAAMMLVLPAYILHDVDFSRAVLIAEGVAVCGAGHVPRLRGGRHPGYPWAWWHLTR